jgi:hypothetical protein
VTIAASTVAADVTGLLMASLLATLGLLVIPARRWRANKDLQANVGGFRVRLAAALRSEFERAQQRSLERLEAVIAPYGRFVKCEAVR